MEQLTYRFSLDTHKNGSQRTLQGFETGDTISRQLIISLTENEESYELPLDNVVAVMYVLRPSQSAPSINECTIEDNKIIYDITADDLMEEGIVKMQVKLISGTIEHPHGVIVSPRFDIEVWESLTQDSEAEDTQEYTALEAALVKAQMCYDGRIVSFTIDEEGVITVVYGYDEQTQTHVTYTSDFLKNAIADIEPTIEIGTVTQGSVPSVTNVGTAQHAIFDFVLVKGDRGEDGTDGQDGQDGADGFSPIANVTKVGDTATITITDAQGTTTAQVHDGAGGDTVSWNQITQSGTKIATVNISGTSYDVYAPTSGGGGGATSFAGLDDVSLSNLQNGQVPLYDSATSKWKNGAIPAQVWADILNKPFSSIGANLSVTNGVLNATDTTYGVVSTSANGLAPQLPNEVNTKKFLKADGTWAEPTGGHTIKNPSGTSMTQRDNLQFIGGTVSVTDDAANNTTKVTISGGGGGLLPHIIVITEEGSTVTATKTGEATVTFVETSTGHYEGDVTAYGTWTIHSVLDGDDATTSLVVDDCKIYTIDDAHFSASITAYYPQGGTCSCSMTGEQTLYANTCPYTFTVHKAGTWTISTTEYGETFTEDVVITTDGQTETVSLPDGSIITPTDDVPALLACAGIGDSQDATLSDLLADSTTLLTVLTTDNAIDYLVRSTTFASAITADADAMEMIGSYDYCADTLLADSTWATAIGGSTYASNVLNISVPTMTSNTTPSGVVSARDNNSGYDANSQPYMAFDESTSTKWHGLYSATPYVPTWLRYQFPSAKKCSFARMTPWVYNGNARVQTYKYQGSNDATTWTDLTETLTALNSETPNNAIFSKNVASYKYYQIDIESIYQSGMAGSIVELNFYGRENGGVQSWLRSGGITDKSYTTLAEVLADTTTLSALIANHDAVDYLVTAKGLIDGIVADATAMSYIGLNNYCANTLLADADWLSGIANSTYKETVLNVKVPVMTSNTTPSGVASASSEHMPAYQAFNGNTSSGWQSNSVANHSGDYIAYKFSQSVCVKYVETYIGLHNATGTNITVKVRASNDNANWTDLTDSFTANLNNLKTVALDNTNSYLYYQIYIVSGGITNSRARCTLLQFYGREDV